MCCHDSVKNSAKFVQQSDGNYIKVPQKSWRREKKRGRKNPERISNLSSGGSRQQNITQIAWSICETVQSRSRRFNEAFWPAVESYAEGPLIRPLGHCVQEIICFRESLEIIYLSCESRKVVSSSYLYYFRSLLWNCSTLVKCCWYISFLLYNMLLEFNCYFEVCTFPIQRL